jgi:PAS domain S-box-containing protein
MTPEPSSADRASLLARIRELESKVEEQEDTLEAIRRGEVDAVVVTARPGAHRVYTLETADRPYQVLIEQMQEGAVTLGMDGTILYSNRRLSGMLNIPQESVIGQTLHQFMPADDADRFGLLLGEAKHGGARDELTLLGADGTAIPVYISLSVLYLENTNLMCGVLTDLTAQKVHLHELAEANARLTKEMAERALAEDALRQSQKMEVIGQLTGGIAHDFNNMLQAITGGITLAQRRIARGKDEAALTLLEAALTAAGRAATLTHRLLAFGRRQALDTKLLALGDLIGGMAGVIERTVGPGITVNVQMKDGCWPVRCDANQLENALLNLAINARDALPAGGRLDIETAAETLEEADTIGWDGAAPGAYVRITVADNGTGMTADVMSHAFEPFFTTKPVGQGTGLGLSQIYGFMRQSRGMARLESALGAGTSVHLYLPRGHGEAVEAGTTASNPTWQRPRAVASATVLLVEDEETIRTVIAEALREYGYRVLEADEGASGLRALQEALRAPHEDAVSLLVTDLGLPGGLDGRQLADAARELVPNLPILLITGYAGDAITGQGHLGPGMDLLSKPFALGALIERVQALIDGSTRRISSSALPSNVVPEDDASGRTRSSILRKSHG